MRALARRKVDPRKARIGAPGFQFRPKTTRVGRPRKLDGEGRLLVVVLRRGGQSLKQVVAATGVPLSSVKRVLSAYGVRRPPRVKRSLVATANSHHRASLARTVYDLWDLVFQASMSGSPGCVPYSTYRMVRGDRDTDESLRQAFRRTRKVLASVGITFERRLVVEVVGTRPARDEIVFAHRRLRAFLRREIDAAAEALGESVEEDET